MFGKRGFTRSSAPATAPNSGRTPARTVGLVLTLTLGLSGCSAISETSLDTATDWALDQLIDITDPNAPEGASLFEANGELFVSDLTATETLATLPTKGRAQKQGYDREAQFGSAWADIDRNGCDTRNDILQRDLTNAHIDEDCRVITGTLPDPFTGSNIDFQRGASTSSDVQIDHIVSLSDAWQTGAQQLSDLQRVQLSNDPLNLIAVDGPSNSSKGDSNAASWLPPNREFRCHYIARQISVKAEYQLWVTSSEREAMSQVLRGCPEQPAYRSVISER